MAFIDLIDEWSRLGKAMEKKNYTNFREYRSPK